MKIFTAFLRLGLTSFGGPIAHIAYFRTEFVERRRWLSDSQFAQLLALCQFLPGPASSQLGFSIGLLRGGWIGALAAFIAFTAPSALLMIAFAASLPTITGTGDAVLHGLKLVALPIVAQGVISMARQLCPDFTRASIAFVAALLALLFGQAWMQLGVVAVGALAGWVLCRSVPAISDADLPISYGTKLGWTLLGLFSVLLVVSLLLPTSPAAAFYRAGSLVFGGGHVVLPLLEAAVVAPGWISHDVFLTGYGAAQAVPGPLFTIAAYLGWQLPGGTSGALVALIAIFLPGFLLVAGTLPLWKGLSSKPNWTRALAGVNAAVVGLLAAALYDPIWIGTVRGLSDLVIAAVGLLLAMYRVPALLIVLWCVSANVAVNLSWLPLPSS